LQQDEPDHRTSRLANSVLSNTCFYANSFRHLQVHTQARKVWRSAAPLKCKIFCCLAQCHHLPTDGRRFRHRLTTSASPISYKNQKTSKLYTPSGSK
jgi:hypothetical protein